MVALSSNPRFLIISTSTIVDGDRNVLAEWQAKVVERDLDDLVGVELALVLADDHMRQLLLHHSNLRCGLGRYCGRVPEIGEDEAKEENAHEGSSEEEGRAKVSPFSGHCEITRVGHPINTKLFNSVCVN